MKKIQIVLLFLLVTIFEANYNCYGQNSVIWQKIVGDISAEDYPMFTKTSDGGYILVAEPGRIKSDVDKDSEEYRLVKFSPAGDIEWKTTFNGMDDDDVISVRQTQDGGYIIGAIIDAGTTKKKKYEPRYSVKRGIGEGDDYWVIKTDSKGKIQWQTYFGGEDDDELTDVFQTNDGGFMIYGESDSEDEKVLTSHGEGDFWVIKTDASGNMEWQKCYGGSKYEEPDYAFQTIDNNYYFAGETQSNDGDVKNHIGMKDAWVIKTDSHGNLLWEKSLGTKYNDNIKAFSLVSDGGVVACGQKGYSVNSDTIYNWATKLSTSGMIEWTTRLDTNKNNFIISSLPTLNGGVLIAGYTKHIITHKRVSYNDSTEYKYWTVELDKNGREQSRNDIGTFYNAIASSFIITADNKYFLVGNIEVTNKFGANDRNNLWMVKIKP